MTPKYKIIIEHITGSVTHLFSRKIPYFGYRSHEAPASGLFKNHVPTIFYYPHEDESHTKKYILDPGDYVHIEIMELTFTQTQRDTWKLQ